MSVSMPLQQAETPIHIDLIIVCRKQDKSKSKLIEKNIIDNALTAASNQVNELGDHIDISLGDAKVALMGRLLCELSMIGELDRELKFLAQSEGRIDELLEKIIEEQKNVTYKLDNQPAQLSLFEQAGGYLS